MKRRRKKRCVCMCVMVQCNIIDTWERQSSSSSSNADIYLEKDRQNENERRTRRIFFFFSFFFPSFYLGKQPGKESKKKGISFFLILHWGFFFVGLACSSFLILSRRVHHQRKKNLYRHHNCSIIETYVVTVRIWQKKRSHKEWKNDSYFWLIC